MKKYSIWCLIAVSVFIMNNCNSNDRSSLTINSPDKRISVGFFLNKEDQGGYKIDFNEKTIIDSSLFSFDFKDQNTFGPNLKVINSSTSLFDETWETVWGEQKYVRNNYNELKVEVEEKSNLQRRCFMVFRVFNDGVGFRFEFPEQKNLKDVTILDENTQFNLTGNHTCWWEPGDWGIYGERTMPTGFDR